jgi:hypothetical protein
MIRDILTPRLEENPIRVSTVVRARPLVHLLWRNTRDGVVPDFEFLRDALTQVGVLREAFASFSTQRRTEFDPPCLVFGDMRIIDRENDTKSFVELKDRQGLLARGQKQFAVGSLQLPYQISIKVTYRKLFNYKAQWNVIRARIGRRGNGIGRAHVPTRSRFLECEITAMRANSSETMRDSPTPPFLLSILHTAVTINDITIKS